MSNCLSKLSAVRSLLLAALAPIGATGCLGDPALQTSEDVEVVTSALTTTYPLYLRSIVLFEDGETVGDPEIYVICKTPTRWSARKDLTYVNDTKETYTPNIKMMDIYSTDPYVTCEVWEGDGNATGQDFLGYGTFTPAQLAGTTATACQPGLEGDVLIGVSKVKGPNTCPEAAFLGIVCDQKCTNIRNY